MKPVKNVLFVLGCLIAAALPAPDSNASTDTDACVRDYGIPVRHLPARPSCLAGRLTSEAIQNINSVIWRCTGVDDVDPNYLLSHSEEIVKCMWNEALSRNRVSACYNVEAAEWNQKSQ